MQDSHNLSQRLSRVNLNLLVAFHALYQERHLTRAANRISLSQPAMSHALKKLRSQFGDELFIKTSEGMQPTPLANRLFQRIETGLLQLDEAIISSHSFNPEKEVREFRIGITDFMISELVPYLVRAVNEQAPGISFNILYTKISSPEMAYKLLQDQELDLAISQFEYLPQGTCYEMLYEDHLVCVGDETIYGKKEALSLDEFLTPSHVALSHREDEPILVNRKLISLGMQRKVVVKTPYIATLPAILTGTNMITVITEYGAELICPKSSLKTYQMPIEFDPLYVCQIWENRKDDDPGIHWLRTVVRNCLQEQGISR
ncbi:LysR family transcriptional regulator [Oceanospirillum linum]|uniref:HTH lysR-type domain-containing protein n=1 Tax=Oceanospirillum linum TaxID=966 RepID=A0A1T1HEH7_OCELI|nr:LysR family transcriptional regulator [Oceanospirillum linum]OOV88212.1 hypothetical protein BTA35_0201360 [Oceanospirillum linum]SEF47968.1 DNA-binding transcriptional regulator, LysR family [Oleiphilus messinensis]SMP02642.1 transcriptional regulator, LysR family [Oceanospirillum linum]